jgi:hypothetical protein
MQAIEKTEFSHACQNGPSIVWNNKLHRKDYPMTVDRITSYSNQSLGFDANLNGGSMRDLLSARVSTRTIGMQLGKLGVSLSTQNISLDEPAPKILKDFAQELELQYLTQHVSPYRPAGAYGANATTQRLGAMAYGQQHAAVRNISPMISVMV